MQVVGKNENKLEKKEEPIFQLNNYTSELNIPFFFIFFFFFLLGN
jgi:hypothetical protein